jgi:hypothetical protein
MLQRARAAAAAAAAAFDIGTNAAQVTVFSLEITTPCVVCRLPSVAASSAHRRRHASCEVARASPRCFFRPPGHHGKQSRSRRIARLLSAIHS